MISEISAQLIAKFAENLRARINAALPVAGETLTDNAGTPPHSELSVPGLLWNTWLNRLKRLFGRA